MCEEIIKESEDLENQKKYKESFALLDKTHKDFPTDIEISWRLSRAYFNLADEKPKDLVWRKEQYTKGLEVAQDVLKQNDQFWAGHKWVAIMLSSLSELLPPKEKIENSFKIKVLKSHRA